METSLTPSIAAKKALSISHKTTKRTNKLDAFFKSQAKHETAWFIVSLIFQGVCFLPVPVVLAYYLGAPSYLIVVTLVLFFSNIIAGMSSAGIRAIISLLAASIVIHALLIAFYLIK